MGVGGREGRKNGELEGRRRARNEGRWEGRKKGGRGEDQRAGRRPVALPSSNAGCAGLPSLPFPLSPGWLQWASVAINHSACFKKLVSF